MTTKEEKTFIEATKKKVAEAIRGMSSDTVDAMRYAVTSERFRGLKEMLDEAKIRPVWNSPVERMRDLPKTAIEGTVIQVEETKIPFIMIKGKWNDYSVGTKLRTTLEPDTISPEAVFGGITWKDSVKTHIHLPHADEPDTVRMVEDTKKTYIFRNNRWYPFNEEHEGLLRETRASKFKPTKEQLQEQQEARDFMQELKRI